MSRDSERKSHPSSRILMIAPTPFFADRGCHVRIYEEARALQEIGYTVEICTYHLGDDRPGLVTHRIPSIPWYNKLSAGPSWHKLYIDLLLLFKTWAVARRFRPDLIHGHLHEGAAIGWVVGRLVGVPVVGDFQGSLSGELEAHRFIPGRGVLYRFVAHNEGWLDRLPQVAVASCDDVAQELHTRFGVRDVILASDGADTELFHPDANVGDLQSLVPPGSRVVVYLGVLSPYQGTDHLLEAVPGVLSRVPEAYFLIMGYPDEDRYRRKALALGVAERVHFTGRIDYDQAARYLALGEVAVGPKLSETESNGKLYNYMACALPTVAFDTPPSREILGDLGVYAPPGDVAALAEGIVGLLEDHDASRELGFKLRQRVMEHFSWQNTARQLATAYEGAVARKQETRNGSKEGSKARHRITNLLKVAISLLGLLMIVLTQDMNEVFQLLRNMDWLPFLGALFLSIAGVPVRAFRWGSLVWALGVRVRWPRLVELYFVGSFFNMFLPTGLGGDAVKMYELSRAEHKAAPAISSVLVDRFLGLLVLFAMALVALLMGYELVPFEVWIVIVVVFFGSLIAVGLLLQRTWIAAVGRRLGVSRLLDRFQILRELYDSLYLYGTAALLRAIAASIAFNLMLILTNYLLGLAVGLDVSLWYYFLFIPIISALLTVPSVGGLGVREAGYVFLFSQIEGVDNSQAAALAFAYLFTLVINGLVGGVLYLLQGMRESQR